MYGRITFGAEELSDRRTQHGQPVGRPRKRGTTSSLELKFVRHTLLRRVRRRDYQGDNVFNMRAIKKNTHESKSPVRLLTDQPNYQTDAHCNEETTARNLSRPQQRLRT